MKQHFFVGVCIIALVTMIPKTVCAYPVIDSLIVQPSNPTTADSISFEILQFSVCRTVEIGVDSVCLLGDTAMLLYRIIIGGANIIFCPVGADTAHPTLSGIFQFVSGPLKAGSYAIYFGKSLSLGATMKIGELTVTNPVNISQPIFSKNTNPSVRNTPIAAYNIRGELINAGANRFTQGIYIVKTASGHFEISNSVNRWH